MYCHEVILPPVAKYNRIATVKDTMTVMMALMIRASHLPDPSLLFSASSSFRSLFHTSFHDSGWGHVVACLRTESATFLIMSVN